MGTNGTEIVAERWLDQDAFRLPRVDRASPAIEEPRPAERGFKETGQDLALAPLVDKIAYGLARGLVVAMKELENHIASETRNVSDTVGRRLDSLQASFQELSGAVSEQRAVGLAVQEKCQQLAAETASLQEAGVRQAEDLVVLRTETRDLAASVSERIAATAAALQESDLRQQAETVSLREQAREISNVVSQRIDAATASLQEADARQAAELAALRNETKEASNSLSGRIDAMCKELGVQQEDIAAVKSTLCGFSERVDAVVERLDRQAEALRSMYATYAQRETELEQLVDGLARLRAYPAPAPNNRL